MPADCRGYQPETGRKRRDTSRKGVSEWDGFTLLLPQRWKLPALVGLKMFSRKKNLANLLLFTGGFALSYLFLYLSLDFLDMSIAYAVWMGLGTAGAVTINMIFFGESPQTVPDRERRTDYHRRRRTQNGFIKIQIKIQKTHISS